MAHDGMADGQEPRRGGTARRVFGVLLIGVGVFGIVMAFVFPFVIVPHSKKTPLDLDITQRSSGPAKLLDPKTNTLQNVQLRATRVVKTDSKYSNDTDTTVNETLCIVKVVGNTPDCTKDSRLLSLTTDRVTANRKSGEAVHVAGWNENVNGKSVRHTGLSYKFPIDTEKKTYQFYEPDLTAAFPATYQGTEKVKGLKTYKFVSNTGQQKYKLFGTIAGFYTDTRTVWVEPQTGTIVKGTEHQVQNLGDANGKPGQLALDTTLSFEDSAITYQTNYAKSKIDDLKLAGVWAPLACGIVGLLALVGAFLLLGRRRRPATGGDGGQHRPGGGPGDGPDDGSDYDPNYSPFAGSTHT
ncbi:DUF3068 domain-containing protein [uncultured Jatrophihabitans sp.]|uniref:DUF3068 domain-containing protein n=1 Tax=uncultured Jatrophihabitans sp. TaxID=1610747 RepID=UPI0035CA06FF